MAETPQNEAAKNQNENAKKQLAEEKKRSDKSKAASAEHLSKGKPTPTQEENDLAALGAHIMEKEDDGSGPDPSTSTQQRSMEGGSAAPYQTRQVTPATAKQPAGAPPRHE